MQVENLHIEFLFVCRVFNQEKEYFFFSKNKMVQDIYLFIFVWLFGLYHATEYAGM